MRELFAFIRAEIELGIIKVKIRLDNLVDRLDPHLGEISEDYDDLPTLDDVEQFLDRVARVTDTIEVHPSMVEKYLTGPLGIELLPWQRDVLAGVYGQQVQR